MKYLTLDSCRWDICQSPEILGCARSAGPQKAVSTAMLFSISEITRALLRGGVERISSQAVVRLRPLRIRDLVENEPGWRSTTSESCVRGSYTRLLSATIVQAIAGSNMTKSENSRPIRISRGPRGCVDWRQSSAPSTTQPAV